MSLFDLTKEASVLVDQVSMLRRRTMYSVIASAMAELGECAEEVAITEKHSYKEQGKDGIIGEAIDTIVCMLDLIHLVDPQIEEGELETIAHHKLRKWITKVQKANE